MPEYPSHALTESPSDRPRRSSVRAFTHIKGPLHITPLHVREFRPFFLAFPFSCCHAAEEEGDRPIHTHTHQVRPGLMTSPTRLPARSPPLSATLLAHSSGNDKYLATEEVTVQLTEGERERATLPLMLSTPTHHLMDLSSSFSHFQNFGMQGCQIIGNT